MASRDEDFGADLVLTEGNDAIWSPSGPAPGREARDWRSLYEQAHARAERECSRADAAEARAEELRCLRPLHRVSAWMSDQGLPISVGTLADRPGSIQGDSGGLRNNRNTP